MNTIIDAIASSKIVIISSHHVIILAEAYEASALSNQWNFTLFLI